ncbi:MAG: hypothetical protein Q7T57_06050 [Dehalococcoidales bacterium]|nr:hypothetical protein [Dehalococcoidales bacterium]
MSEKEGMQEPHTLNEQIETTQRERERERVRERERLREREREREICSLVDETLSCTEQICSTHSRIGVDSASTPTYCIGSSQQYRINIA